LRFLIKISFTCRAVPLVLKHYETSFILKKTYAAVSQIIVKESHKLFQTKRFIETF